MWIRIRSLAASAFLWVGIVLFVLFIGSLFAIFQGAEPGEFAQGLVTIGGVVSVLTGLGFALGQSLKDPHQSWVNRETKNLLSGVFLWFMAAFAQYIFALNAHVYKEFFFGVIWIILSGTMGMVATLATMFTLFPSSYLFDYLQNPESMEKLEQTWDKSNKFMRRVYRILNRTK